MPLADPNPLASPDSDVLARLRDSVEQVTQKMGTTEHAEVVGSTRHRAEPHVMGAPSPPPDRPVWVVQVVGDFVIHRARGRPIRPHRPMQPPHYRVLILVIDAADYHLFSLSTRREATDLTALGEVTHL